MAVVTSIEKSDQAFRSLHLTETRCEYLIGTAVGQKVLQLNTFGSGNRQVKDEYSQTMRFDQTAASELFALLKHEFGFE